MSRSARKLKRAMEKKENKDKRDSNHRIYESRSPDKRDKKLKISIRRGYEEFPSK